MSNLTKESLCAYFGEKEDSGIIQYAITPYESKEEYERDKNLLAQYSSAASPQTKFLMIHAAKIARTPKEFII